MTCFRFFIPEIVAVQCPEKTIVQLERNGYGITIHQADELSGRPLGLYPGRGKNIWTVNWDNYDALVIGNEKHGLPKSLPCDKATIPTRDGKCLTVESATAIACCLATRGMVPPC